MLNQRKVSVSCLLVYTGFILGFSLLAAAQLVGDDDLARWGIAVLCVTCTYTIHRSITARDERLRQAFEHGRAHEQAQNVAALR